MECLNPKGTLEDVADAGGSIAECAETSGEARGDLVYDFIEPSCEVGREGGRDRADVDK